MCPDSSGLGPNDVFMPLAYSSTLDRHAHTPSYVEELWSPGLEHLRGKEQAKADAYCQRSFHAER